MRAKICLLFFWSAAFIFSFKAYGAETHLPFPSFPCSHATISVEHTICQNSDLRSLDWELDDSFRRAKLSGYNVTSIRESQANWLKLRNECGDINCIFEAYRGRISFLKKISNSIIISTLEYTTPSYNCSRARPGVEEMICADYKLSAYDWSISDTYQRARIYKFSERFDLRQEQNNWIKQRNACNTIECIRSIYNGRISELYNKYNQNNSAYKFSPREIRLSKREAEIADIIVLNVVKCYGKKFITDKFSTPEEKAIVGAIVSAVFDGEAPPSEKIAIGYAIDKIKQRIKENGHPEIAELISDVKMLHCLSNGLL